MWKVNRENKRSLQRKAHSGRGNKSGCSRSSHPVDNITFIGKEQPMQSLVSQTASDIWELIIACPWFSACN